jgi:hypothetical protein
VNNEKKSALTDRLCGSITKRGANVTDSKYQKRLEVTERKVGGWRSYDTDAAEVGSGGANIALRQLCPSTSCRGTGHLSSA